MSLNHALGKESSDEDSFKWRAITLQLVCQPVLELVLHLTLPLSLHCRSRCHSRCIVARVVARVTLSLALSFALELPVVVCTVELIQFPPKCCLVTHQYVVTLALVDLGSGTLCGDYTIQSCCWSNEK